MLLTGRLAILLSHLADQCRVRMWGSAWNCQLSVGDGWLGCTWKSEKHGQSWSLKTNSHLLQGSLTA